MMIWLLLSLNTAFFESLRDVFNKKAVPFSDAYTITFSLSFLTAIFLFPLMLVTGIPPLGVRFGSVLLIDGILNGIAYLLFIQALTISELSQVAPLTTFTPLFLLLTSPILVGEFPKGLGVVGILAIIGGAYLLNCPEPPKKWCDPLKRLMGETGSQLMLTVAFIWSLTSNLDKIGIQNSAPIIWVFSVYLVVAAILFPLVLFKSLRTSQLRQNWKTLVAIGFLNAVTVASQMIALSLTLVAYVIAIKRMSAVFSVIFGWAIFREQGFKTRLWGTGIMLLGVGAIAISKTME
jgi:uncharacterized membrane protein